VTIIRRAAVAAAAVLVGALFSPAAASAQATVTRAPFSAVQFNQCAGGELIEITGTSVVVSRSEGEHTMFNFVLAGAKAVAPSTGAEYVVLIHDRSSSHTEADGTPSVLTVVQHIRFVRLGEDPSLDGDDFDLRFIAHFTTNADGTLVVSFSELELTCR
jgi:hypothetical protein